MSHADPIADMLTRIRNAIRIQMPEVRVKSSGICENIAKVLLAQGFISGYDRIETECKQDDLRITLKYGPIGENIINEIKRASKPSCRVYKTVDTLPKVLGGMGIAILSTSKGLLTDQECRENNIGGELLCTVH